MSVQRSPLSMEERFMEKVFKEPNSGCWLWTSTQRNRGGYGGFSFPGGLRVMAHRLSYQMFVGPIPDGMSVCHKCDTPPCVRPDHLFLGTYADNCADKEAKGRGNHRAGERHGMALLTNQQALEIQNSKVPRKDLARQFGVSISTISALKSGQNWKWLDQTKGAR